MIIEFTPRHPAVQSIADYTVLGLGTLGVWGYFGGPNNIKPIELLVSGIILLLIGVLNVLFTVRKVVFLEDKLVVYRAILKREIPYKQITDLGKADVRSRSGGYSLGRIRNQAEYDRVLQQLFEKRLLRRDQLSGRLPMLQKRVVMVTVAFGIGGYLVSWIAIWAGWLNGLNPELIGSIQFGFVAMVAAVSYIYSSA